MSILSRLLGRPTCNRCHRTGPVYVPGQLATIQEQQKRLYSHPVQHGYLCGKCLDTWGDEWATERVHGGKYYDLFNAWWGNEYAADRVRHIMRDAAEAALNRAGVAALPAAREFQANFKRPGVRFDVFCDEFITRFDPRAAETAKATEEQEKEQRRLEQQAHDKYARELQGSLPKSTDAELLRRLKEELAWREARKEQFHILKPEFDRRGIVIAAIGKELFRRGGAVRMKAVFAEVSSSRTLEMLWDGIGEWRG